MAPEDTKPEYELADGDDKPHTPLAQVQMRQQDVLEQLDSAVNALQRRLRPVLSGSVGKLDGSSTVAAASNKRDFIGTSSVVHMAETQVERGNSILSKVHTIMENLEV